LAQLVSRRSFIGGATASGLLVASSPLFWRQPAIAGTPGATGVHVTFGDDAARDMNVSWSTAGSVSNPRLVLGTAEGGFGRRIPAETVTYTDYGDGVEVFVQHARIHGLQPDSTYVYSVLSDGAPAVQGTFTTAPAGRVPFRFTSFGDIGSGNPDWSKSSLNAITATSQIEQLNPAVHLLNGDLSYANVNQASMAAVWADFATNTQPSAMNTPWMPTLGNHEVEAGNGELGYNSYHTRYRLPSNHNSSFSGNWYSFQVGSVLFVALDNNDVVYENDGGVYLGTTSGPYLLGYSGGQQEQWLARTLRRARQDPTVDWIIAYMHQPAMSSSSSGSGSDLGIRDTWFPLFYEYGVDMVLCGHDHDYERSYAVRGTDPGTFLRPTVISYDTDVVDTSRGLVHIVLGGGGTSSHDDVYGPPDSSDGNDDGQLVSQIYTTYPQVYKAAANETELATWSAVRDPNTTYPWGIGVFDVDPGRFPGDRTSITMTYYHTPAATTSNLNPAPIAYDSFTAVRRRSDGQPGGRSRTDRQAEPARG
jgi:Calcineurin-like phosphoesterase/Purple acid Phosphatase, N-terminal domain